MATLPPTSDPAKPSRKPAASGSRTRAVGQETPKGGIEAAMGGSVMAGDSGISGAVGELNSQHPHQYHDHGPHHGTTDHVRHQPLHGLKPTK